AEDAPARLAGLYQDQGRMPSATATLERLAALRPDDAVLRFRLEHLYSAAGHHAERVPILEALAAKSIPARHAAILYEIGRIHDQHLGSASAAIDAPRRALAVDPQDRTLRGALLSLLRRSGRWEELVAELRAEADLADGRGAARALHTAAAIFERRLGRSADAAAL